MRNLGELPLNIFPHHTQTFMHTELRYQPLNHVWSVVGCDEFSQGLNYILSLGNVYNLVSFGMVDSVA
jgi:hypothetical protein